jgi:hypothetical protein
VDIECQEAIYDITICGNEIPHKQINLFVPGGEIQNYISRIAGHLLEVIDIHVEVQSKSFGIDTQEDLDNALGIFT